MFESMFSIPIALLFLSVLIFIHELAHFLAGKAVGIHADVFSIGFGPPLFKMTRGKTEYRIAMIPAGGYVKFPGEYADDDDERMEGDFHHAAIWKRIVVVAAGPLSNLALGVALFAALAARGLPDKSMPPVGEVVDRDETASVYWDDPTDRSPAAEAGIQPGDRIVAVDGREIGSWEDFTHEIMIRPDQTATLSILRDGDTLDVSVTPRPALRGKMTIGQIGVAASQPLVLIEDDGKTKLKMDAIDGKRVYGFGPFRELARSGAMEPVVLSLANGARREVVVSATVIASAASDESGVPAGARLLEMDGEPVSSMADARRIALSNPTRSRRLTFETDTNKRTVVTVTPNLTVTVAGVDGRRNPDIKRLRLGDKLETVGGRPITDYAATRDVIAAATDAGRPVTMQFRRHSRFLFFKWENLIDVRTQARFDGERVSAPGLRLRPNFGANRSYMTLGNVSLVERLEMFDAGGSTPLTVAYADPELKRYGAVGSLGKGVSMTVDSVEQMLSLLRRLVVGEVSVKYISGPVGIVNITQKTLERGGWSWETFLSIFYLMALISVNLAVVNLLPIPIADGGQLLFFTLEGLRGKPLSVKWQVAIQQVSVLALIALFALVTLKDLVYW